ncbi:NAD(P)H-dependent oxidoreductase [Kribbella sp. NPDC002412]
MATIATISSSPSEISRTDAVLDYVTRRLLSHGHTVTPIVLRDLPAEPLLRGWAGDPAIAAAAGILAAADAVVVTTPVYKAAYSGLLKVFLDLLPQYALKGKTVLPLATGGTPAHVLAIDYALRPRSTSSATDCSTSRPK